MKFTLFLTQRCNLACSYCYVGKSEERMPPELAARLVDFAYEKTPPEEEVDIGFFGGEPLLELPLLLQIADLVQAHPAYGRSRVKLSVVTNGTLLTAEVAQQLKRRQVALNISCDGAPEVQDRFRTFPGGGASSALVERGIRAGLDAFGLVPVNAVYRPETVEALPRTVEYLSSLGVRQIHLTPDFSARWTEADAARAASAYRAVAGLYMQYYREGRPHFVNFLDVKIAVILRGGYQATERCRMGVAEFAFTPSGRIYPCERLAGADPEQHVIGSANGLIRIGPLQPHRAAGPPINAPCLECPLSQYCMNWCGCSNYFMTGSYNRVSPFLCASERAQIEIAFEVFETLESELGPTFFDHLGGMGVIPSVLVPVGGNQPDSRQ